MTDRELLERAAKAAGIKGAYARVHQTYGDLWVEGIDTGSVVLWNPKDDDGDAIRLAVQLRMKVDATEHGIAVYGSYPNLEDADEPHFGMLAVEAYSGHRDAMSAARRAVVRAAARMAPDA